MTVNEIEDVLMATWAIKLVQIYFLAYNFMWLCSPVQISKSPQAGDTAWKQSFLWAAYVLPLPPVKDIIWEHDKPPVSSEGLQGQVNLETVIKYFFVFSCEWGLLKLELVLHMYIQRTNEETGVFHPFPIRRLHLLSPHTWDFTSDSLFICQIGFCNML